MELIRQNPKFYIPKSTLHLPFYLRFIFGTLLGSLMVISSVVPLILSTRSPSNPFAAYANGVAGASSEAEFWSNRKTLYRVAFDLACSTSLIERYCLYRPLTGPFAEIRFMDLNDEGKKGIYFAVRPNALTVGDLALLWGRPKIARQVNSLVLHWSDPQVSTVVRSDNQRFTYLLPVPYLLVEGSNGT